MGQLPKGSVSTEADAWRQLAQDLQTQSRGVAWDPSCRPTATLSSTFSGNGSHLHLFRYFKVFMFPIYETVGHERVLTISGDPERAPFRS